MTVGLITCGALGREVRDLITAHGWDAAIIGVSALDHLRPERIAPDVEARIVALGAQYERLIVVFGDCGSGGALDAVLARHGIERLSGPHCYEMYAGADFEAMMTEEPGTFFLTDFLVRAFRGTVIKGLGLDRYPQLKAEYFAHYRRVVYLAQSPTPALRGRAEAVAAYLGLPLEVRVTGYGWLETRLTALMGEGALAVAHSAPRG
jgi:hypothetical protein